MATNSYKLPGKSSEGGFFKWMERFTPWDHALTDVIHIRFLPQILFVCLICVIYIGSRHYAEKKIRAIGQLQTQVEDLRADYTTLKADYMYSSKQSEVARKAGVLGLEESKVPPFKIIVQEE